MSSFTYDGSRNILCIPAPMSGDVRIQPTPEPIPQPGGGDECSFADRGETDTINLRNGTRGEQNGIERTVTESSGLERRT